MARTKVRAMPSEYSIIFRCFVCVGYVCEGNMIYLLFFLFSVTAACNFEKQILSSVMTFTAVIIIKFMFLVYSAMDSYIMKLPAVSALNVQVISAGVFDWCSDTDRQRLLVSDRAPSEYPQ